MTDFVDFFVDRNSVRVVSPKQHRAMQRLEAALVHEQANVIHRLVRMLDDIDPGFLQTVNKLRKPAKKHRLVIKLIRAADKTRKELGAYGMPWGKGAAK